MNFEKNMSDQEVFVPYKRSHNRQNKGEGTRDQRELSRRRYNVVGEGLKKKSTIGLKNYFKALRDTLIRTLPADSY